MGINILQKIQSFFRSDPSPQFIARQLRKPSGEFAETVAEKMNQVNKPLFDLTCQTLQINDNESILEIGFGSGKFFPRLFQQAEGVQINGIDHSEEMVQEARRKNENLIDSGQLQIIRANSNDIPFSDQSFDKVFCNMVIYFWDQPEDHLEEIHRVLKPGGKFYTGMRSTESMKVFPFVEYGFNLFGVSDWTTLLEENGFENIQTELQSDPEIQLDGKPLRMESICVVATKGGV